MKEIVELRISEELAKKFFERHEGKVLGEKGIYEVRQIFLATSDPRYLEVERLEKKYQSKGSFFFSSWDFKRSYSKSEFEAASLFQLIFMPEFEPSGEECGTVYDEMMACPKCGAGAIQTSPLILRESSIPKSKDFLYTIADNEFIVSERCKRLFEESRISGIHFGPIITDKKKNEPSTDWYQMFVIYAGVEIHAATKFGIGPFDVDLKGEYRCVNGHKAGLNILTELTVHMESLRAFDVMASRQYAGLRSGLLRPRPLFVISPKVRKIILENKLKGARIEVAHML